MRVLLTGASGFIGQALVEQLLGEGLQVACLLRDPAKMAQLPWRDRVEILQADLLCESDLTQACRGRDLLIHCAGLAHSNRGGLEAHRAIHVDATARLLRAALATGLPRLLYLSSSKAACPEAGPYAQAKREAESLLLQAQGQGAIEVCCLRPTAVYGPGMKGNLAAWMRLVGRGLAPPLPPALSTRIPMIGRADLCRAMIATLHSAPLWGHTWTLSDGQPYRIKEIEDCLRQAWGRAPAAWGLPEAVFRAVASGSEAMKRLGLPAGFGEAGYNTLFREEPLPDSSFQDACAWRPRQRFQDVLPAIRNGIQQ